MPVVRPIDTHVHVWQAGSLQTAWLDLPPVAGDPRWAPLRASFSLEDLQTLADAEDIGQVVLVEAADDLAETEALLALARSHDRVLGAVGWLPLADPAAFEPALARHGADPALVGVRHMIHTEADPSWVLQADVVAAIRELGAAGLTFDYIGVSREHLAAVPRLAEACPETTIVLEHLNNPPIASGDMADWATGLGAAAASANLVAKVSGLEICARWGDWTPADWRPYLDHALEVFGPERLMLGSNWPVSTLSGSYGKIWAAHRAWLASLSLTEQSAIAAGTAHRVYGKPPKRGAFAPI